MLSAMGKVARIAPGMGYRASLISPTALRPLRAPTRSVQTAAAHSNPVDNGTQVPVQQQHAKPQQQTQQVHRQNIQGGGSAQQQQGVARQSPPQQQQHMQQQMQQPQQQRQQLGRRLQRQPLSAALSPFAEFSTVAPGFGRMGSFLRSIEDEMDTMMRALEYGDVSDSGSSLASPTNNMQQSFDLPLHVDIHETDKQIVLKADTPGMTGPDVKVTYEPESRMLAISGERSAEHSEKDEAGRFARYERRFGAFQRRFKLPNNVDTSAISAKVINGELEVRLPKTDESASKQQEIKVQ